MASYSPAAARAYLVALLLLAPLPAAAWTPRCQVVIAEEAARLAPPDLYPLIDRHRRQLRAGAVAPFQDRDPMRHVKNPDGSGSLDRVIEEEVEAAIDAIRSHRPFAEIVHQLGVVSHFVADANDPLNTSDSDPRERDYFADYLRYMESAEPRFPLLFYGITPGLDEQPSLAGLVRRTLERSRQLYPLIGLEYRRIGFASGVGAFDDRSTAFGVASLSFSHAVSDMTQVLRYIWIRAGGIDERKGLPARGELLLLLPRYQPHG